MSTKLFLSIPIIQLEIHYREISGHLNEKENSMVSYFHLCDGQTSMINGYKSPSTCQHHHTPVSFNKEDMKDGDTYLWIHYLRVQWRLRQLHKSKATLPLQPAYTPLLCNGLCRNCTKVDAKQLPTMEL